MRSLYPRLGVDSSFDASYRHVTSPIMSPFILAILRLTIALYTLTTLIITLVWTCVVEHEGASYFSYFTYLTYVGLCAYFWAAGIQTWVFSRRLRARGHVGRLRLDDSRIRAVHMEEGTSKDSGRTVSYPLQSWPRPLQALHVWLQVSVHTFPLLVTIVYWAILASPNSFATPFDAYSNISIHILNTVFSLTDILFTHSPPAPWLLLPLVFLALAAYLGVAYITYATQGIYPYPFLNPSKQHNLLGAYIVGIAVAYCIVFLVVRGVVVVRAGGLHRLRKWNWRGRDTVGTGTEDLEDWEEVEVPGRERPSVSPIEGRKEGIS